MSDVSTVTKLLAKVNEGFTSTLGSSIASNAANVPLTNVVGLTNNSTFVGIVEPGLTNQQVFTGQVDTSGSQIINVKWTRGSNVAHSGGVTVVDYSTGTVINMLTKWAATQHNDDGTHSNITAQAITTTGNGTFGGSVSVAGSMSVAGKDISNLTPAGSMIMFATSTAPSGWLICDGSAVSRTTFSALYAAIGTTYGTGDGTSTFNLPNFKGKAPFGLDSSQTEFSSLAQTGGQKVVQAHTHGVNDGGHYHLLWSIGQEGGGYTLSSQSTRAVLIGGNPDAGNGRTGFANSNISIQSAGTGGNNLNPYLTVNFIIKT